MGVSEHNIQQNSPPPLCKDSLAVNTSDIEKLKMECQERDRMDSERSTSSGFEGLEDLEPLELDDIAKLSVDRRER